MNSKKLALLFSLQASKGVSPVLTGADFVGVYGINCNPYKGDKKGSNVVKPYEGNNPEYNSNPHSELSFKVDLPFNLVAVAGAVPLIGGLLRNCALSETIDLTVNAEKVYYSLLADMNAGEYGVYEYFEDSQKYRIENARGVVTSIETTSQGFITFSFSMLGDVALPTTAVFPVIDLTPWEFVKPVNFDNTPNISLFGQDVVLKGVGLSNGQGQSYESNPGGKGHKYHGGTRNISGNFDIKAPTLATYDYFAQLKSDDGVLRTGAVNLQHGTVSGQNFALPVPKVQITDISRNDSEGEWDYSNSFNALPESGNDDFTLEFNKFIAAV